MYAQNFEAYKKERIILKGDTLPYRILLPKNFETNVSYPLIIFLHGSGERGNDNNLQLTHGANLFLNESVRNKYPAIVVFPQCALNYTWSNYKRDKKTNEIVFNYQKRDKIKHQELLKTLIKVLQNKYQLDANRFYIGGLSIGGMGTFEAVKQNPNLFAAAFPICGGANPEIAKYLNKTSWWIFHGAEDNVIPVKYSQQMYDALKNKNADVKLTIYPNVKHGSWNNAFAEPDLLSWLFSKSL